MKYESTDAVTGYSVGEIVELTGEELAKVPFNVKMKLVENVKPTPKTTKKKATRKRGDFDGDGDVDADDKKIASRVIEDIKGE